MATERQIMITIGADGRAALAEMDKVGVAAGRMQQTTTASTDQAARSMQAMELATRYAVAAFSASAVMAFAKQLHEAGMASERLTNSFAAATGSAEYGAKAMAFARYEAARLGLDLLSTSDAFLKISAASKDTTLEGVKTQQIFTSVAGASRALGLSAQEMQGALLAISQMISKGTVQAEELRGQLGERLPGAFQIAARAMGVTTSQLDEMLKKGDVIASDFLPKFAAELQRTFPPSEKAMSGLTAETERMKTAWLELKIAIMSSGGETMFTGAIKGVREFTQDLAAAIKSMDDYGKKFLAIMMPGLMLTGSKMLGVSDQFKEKPYVQASETGWETDPNAKKPTDKPAKKAADHAKKLAEEWRKAYADIRTEIDNLDPALEKHDQQINKVFNRFSDLLQKEGADAVQLTMLRAELVQAIEGRAQYDKAVKQNKQELEDYAAASAATTAMENANIQEAINARVIQSGWDATRKANLADELSMTADFHAMKMAMFDEGLSQERLRLDEEQAYWEYHYAMATDSFEVYERRKAEIAEIYSKKRQQVDQRETALKMQWAKSGFGSMATIADAFYQLSGKKSKEAFKVYQVMKSGETVISTADAAMKAYSAMAGIPIVGPSLGVAAAAAAVAAGAVQLQQIWSTSPDGGNSSVSNVNGSSASSGSALTGLSSVQPTSSATNEKTPPQLQLIVYGNVVDHDKFARELMVSIQKAVNDGYSTTGYSTL